MRAGRETGMAHCPCLLFARHPLMYLRAAHHQTHLAAETVLCAFRHPGRAVFTRIFTPGKKMIRRGLNSNYKITTLILTL